MNEKGVVYSGRPLKLRQGPADGEVEGIRKEPWGLTALTQDTDNGPIVAIRRMIPPGEELCRFGSAQTDETSRRDWVAAEKIVGYLNALENALMGEGTGRK